MMAYYIVYYGNSAATKYEGVSNFFMLVNLLPIIYMKFLTLAEGERFWRVRSTCFPVSLQRAFLDARVCSG